MFAPHLDLNPLIEGWEILSWSIGPTGEEIHLLLVESAKKVEGMRYMLGDCPGHDAKLLCVSEHYHWDLSLPGLTRAFSYYCGLTSDRHLMFSPERIGQPNATLFDGGGNELCRFWVGDHVEHLQSDTSGNLWVSYYDQGFGKEYSERGLSCYDSNGHAVNPWWNCPMMDCYAMNAGKDGVWHCGYSYFSIVHVGSDRGQREWSNRHVSGARAIVGWGQSVALYGGYRERGQHLTTLKLKSHDFGHEGWALGRRYSANPYRSPLAWQDSRSLSWMQTFTINWLRSDWRQRKQRILTTPSVCA